jgi:tripartite ATP-independent transporter DctM subunit
MHPAILLFGSFFFLMFAGVPIAASLGLAGTLVIALEGLGIMAVPTNVYAGIAKYPLLAIPMFVLAGAIFDRSGVAGRLLRFITAIIGQGRGSLAAITILVAMIIGGISGSGPACTAAVGGVMLGAMMRAGYPPGFAASVTAAAGSTDILIPPSVAFIIYSVLVPSATVPALFVAGIGPGILACIALIIPAVLLSLYHGFGAAQGKKETRPEFWRSFKEAFWALMAPLLILGGMRTGWFTPTEAAVMAVFYGLIVGVFIYRSLTLRDIFGLLVESAETSAVILIVVGLASVFAWASSTLGIVDPIARGLVALGGGETGVIVILMLFLVIVGMFLDGISIFLIFLPLFVPVAEAFHWDLVWFGVLMTYNIALGQFTPPMAVNLMVSCRLSGASMESTVRWDIWMLLSMFLGLLLLIAFPAVAIWLPKVLGFM